jgi:hypothetical protein
MIKFWREITFLTLLLLLLQFLPFINADLLFSILFLLSSTSHSPPISVCLHLNPSCCRILAVGRPQVRTPASLANIHRGCPVGILVVESSSKGVCDLA